MAAHDRNVPKKNQDTRSPKQSTTDFSKLMQVVFDMKAEMGSMRRAMTNAGISFEKYPSGSKQREQSANGKQKNKFAGTVQTKNKANRVAQRSLVQVQPRNEVSDSDDENYPEYGGIATIVKKPKKRHVSPRATNAMLVGITKRRDPDMRRISDSEPSVDQALGSDEFDAQTSIDGSFQQDLFGEYFQKALESRDVMDQQGDAQEDQNVKESTPELEPYSDDSA